MTDQEEKPRSEIPAEEVALKVRQVVAQSLELDVENVKLESSLYQLGAESLDLLDMAFMLEKEYKIQFPRTDILERATQHFGEEALVSNGLVTDLGQKLLLKGMPELNPSVVKPGLRAIDVAQMITVGSFVRITQRLLEAKANFNQQCPKCGGKLAESDVMPEFECSQCGEVVPLPSGDEILLKDLIALFEDTQVDV